MTPLSVTSPTSISGFPSPPNSNNGNSSGRNEYSKTAKKTPFAVPTSLSASIIPTSTNLCATVRSALVLTLFIVVIIQLQLTLSQYYNGSADHLAGCSYLQHPTGIHELDAHQALLAQTQQQQRQVQQQQNIINTNSHNNLLPAATPPITSQNSLQKSQSLQTAQNQPTGTGVGLNAPNSKELPHVNSQGVIIFYLHIPKSGGTSLSVPFEHDKHWRYRMVYGWNKQDKFSQEMYNTLNNWKPGMRIFYEYHAGKASPYMDETVRKDLKQWRELAKQQGIPFFAFTVVREPLSFAVSHFNFYYASRKKDDTRYFYVPNPTEEDFVRLTLPNPQCLFCVHTEVAYYQDYRERGGPVDVPKEGCEAVYQAFLEDMDWIGTTETLSTQTFPILEQVGHVQYLPFVKNKSKDKIVKSELSPEAVAHVRSITQYDLDIYQRAQQDFPLEMWSNFEAHPLKRKELQQQRRQEHNIVDIVMKNHDTPDLLGIEKRKREREARLEQKRAAKKKGKQQQQQEQQ